MSFVLTPLMHVVCRLTSSRCSSPHSRGPPGRWGVSLHRPIYLLDHSKSETDQYASYPRQEQNPGHWSQRLRRFVSCPRPLIIPLSWSRALIRELLNTGYQVTGTVRTKEKGVYLGNLFNGLPFEYSVVEDISKVRSCLSGCK